MSFRQLYDHYTQSIYTIDNNSMIFKITSEELNLEFRLKPYSAAIIFALFKEHPRPLLYSNLRSILKKVLFPVLMIHVFTGKYQSLDHF